MMIMDHHHHAMELADLADKAKRLGKKRRSQGIFP